MVGWAQVRVYLLCYLAVFHMYDVMCTGRCHPPSAGWYYVGIVGQRSSKMAMGTKLLHWQAKVIDMASVLRIVHNSVNAKFLLFWFLATTLEWNLRRSEVPLPSSYDRWLCTRNISKHKVKEYFFVFWLGFEPSPVFGYTRCWIGTQSFVRTVRKTGHYYMAKIKICFKASVTYNDFRAVKVVLHAPYTPEWRGVAVSWLPALTIYTFNFTPFLLKCFHCVRSRLYRVIYPQQSLTGGPPDCTATGGY
jgi:hypothetical protein